MSIYAMGRNLSLLELTLTGEIFATVSDTHKSSDFISFLDKLDQRYKDAEKIRIILDNHPAHVSKETMKHLETKPNRFEFVYISKNGYWLNIIECFFSKITRVYVTSVYQVEKSLGYG